MQRKIYATDYDGIQLQLNQVKSLLGGVLDYMYEAPNVETDEGRQNAVQYLIDAGVHCAMLCGAMYILRDVIDGVDAALEEGAA